MNKNYDIIVVGCGPAGARVAKLCAEKGFSVVILEKRNEIGVPVRCGEGISKIKLTQAGIKPDNAWIAKNINYARIYAPNGKSIILSEKYAGGEVGYNIYRDLFDKELAKSACLAGAELHVRTTVVDVIKKNHTVIGVKIKMLDGKDEIYGKIVIAADGYESQVPRWAGINTSLNTNDIISCLEYTITNIDYDSETNEFYVGSVAPGGYAWVFPKDDEANVGLGVQLTKLKNPGDIKKYLDMFIAKRCPKGKIIRIIGGGVSACAPIEKCVGNGILLVGDSARQIDPLTGGGVINGLIAANIAAKVIEKSIDIEDFSENILREYDILWRKEFGDKNYRNWLAKEKAVTLSDEIFNKLIDSLSEFNFEKISTIAILKAVQSKYPELIKEFEALL